jgi:hypothetical protein
MIVSGTKRDCTVESRSVHDQNTNKFSVESFLLLPDETFEKNNHTMYRELCICGKERENEES